MIKYASPTHAYRALILDPSPLTFGGESGYEKGTIIGFVKLISVAVCAVETVNTLIVMCD